MDIYQDLKPLTMLSTIIYSVIGLAIFSVAYIIMDKITPFSMRKEIEEDQNTALAIIMGSVFIALAIIIHGAMK
jgi:putative membrane protein